MKVRSFFSVFSLAASTVIVSFLLMSGAEKVPGKSINSTGNSQEDWAMQKLSEMSLEEKIGQFFMVAAYSGQNEEHLSEVEHFVTNDKVGGIIFFQGEKENLKKAIERYQLLAKTPLLIGMDAEWGTDMRLFDGERFPYAFTLGAADDPELSETIGTMMAQECRELGIQVNFSPVADVNSNPENPVIGFRSFGEQPRKVAEQVSAFVKAFENNGIMSCIKHFPGHGNTSQDSHEELPTVTESKKELEGVNMFPFQEGIRSGAASVMIGHLNVPALDNSGTPASLSKKIIHDYLRKELNFEGLVISDALNMKAVSERYGKTEVCVKAFEAGCDILLFPESVPEAIQAIKYRVEKGEISKKEIDERCLKILKAKYRYVLHPQVKKSYTKGEKEWAKEKVFEKALTVLKSDSTTFPFRQLNVKTARVAIGMHTAHFRDGVELFEDVTNYHYFNAEDALREFKDKAKFFDRLIISLHANSVRPRNNFGFGTKWKEFIAGLPDGKDITLVIFGNPLVLKDAGELKNVKNIVVTYENNALVQQAAAQVLYGAVPASGKLPFKVSDRYPRGSGISMNWSGRLKFSCPEELGIDPEKLKEIDEIAENGVKKGAFPGCQVVVAVQGKIIYRKSFGTHTYKDSTPVDNTDIYDLASVSKIAGSTVGVMRLQTEGKFSLDNHLKDYIESVTGNGEYGSILIRDMMAHQAGLTPWIAFYKRTIKNGELMPRIYSTAKKDSFSLQVAKDIWIRNDYTDTIYKQILTTPLGAKKYVYSDLGYYFIKKIIEKQSGNSFQSFLTDTYYQPMGLRSMRYHPRYYFPLKRIIPTEDDQVFRKQLLQGFVHDPGAAMLGGVGGHAGLFSNATDLASLMQMLLNKGNYGNVQYIDPAVIEEFTRAQFPGNRRGAGFDRPVASGGGPCDKNASQRSYGHSGFTGTLTWSDPEYGINYVFLSNRVCPDQDNWKIRDMNIRTDIQRVIYEAVKSRKEAI